LHQLEARLQAAKTLGAEEDLILQTFKDADLLNAGLLKLSWKQENRDYLMDHLTDIGKGNADIQAQLVKQCRDTGPAWEKIAVGELRKIDDKQKQLHFEGKNSKRKFEGRVAALKGLMERGNCYLQSATPQARAVIATILARAQTTLADEIKASPIPDGVDEEGKAGVQKALAEMAQPFADKSAEFNKLAAEQLGKIEDANLKQALTDKLQATATDDVVYSAIELKSGSSGSSKVAKTEVAAPNAEVLKRATEELHHNPNQKSAMVDLKSYYEASGSPRLAAYFQGRLMQLGEEGKQ
jgi:hypothetical protein